jgi:hypothetical protein
MLKLSKIFVIVSIILFSTGCGKQKRVIVPVVIPSWYLNAPVNNDQFIYGEGEGDTLSEAKNNALNTMAAKLIVSVSSSMKTNTNTSTNGKYSSYNKDVSKSVKVDVEKMKFTNAKVYKNGTVGGKVYILMQVDRQELFANMKKEFDINDNRITKKYRSLKTHTVMEQINMLDQIYPDAISGKKQAIILNAINNKFDQSPFIEKYDNYIDEIAKLKNNITIKVVSNNKEGYFKDQLISMLNNEKYRVVNRRDCDITIKLNNKIKYNMARKWNIAKVTTTISVISNKKIVSNRIITSIGRSTTSRSSALDGASKIFTKKVKEQGLDKIIFGK